MRPVAEVMAFYLLSAATGLVSVAILLHAMNRRMRHEVELYLAGNRFRDYGSSERRIVLADRNCGLETLQHRGMLTGASAPVVAQRTLGELFEPRPETAGDKAG